MRITSEVAGIAPQDVRRMLSGLPDARGYRVVIKPPRPTRPCGVTVRPACLPPPLRCKTTRSGPRAGVASCDGEAKVPADITVLMENRPGALAEIAEALGKAGINIEGMCGFVSSGQ